MQLEANETEWCVVLASRFSALDYPYLLRLLNLRDFRRGVDADFGSEDFDFVRVHLRVGDENLAVLHALGLVDADFLLKQEAVFRRKSVSNFS